MTSDLTKFKILLYFKSITGLEIFIAPVLTLFYLQYVKVPFDVFLLLESVFFIAILVLEIPMGYIADVCGRKLSFLFGTGFTTLGLITPLLLPSTLGFALALLMKSLGTSLASGILNSLSYEYHRKLDKESEYRTFCSHLAMISLISGSLAALLTGFLIKYSLALPLLLDAALTFLSLIAGVFFIKEVTCKSAHMNIIQRFQIQFGDVKSSWPVFYKNIPIIFSLALIFALVRSSYSFYQPLLIQLKFKSSYFGILFAVFNIISSLSAHLSTHVFQNSRIRFFFPSMAGLIFLGGILSFSENAVCLILAFSIQQIYRGFYTSECVYLLNSNIPDTSTSRVTLLSLSNALNMMLVSLFLGIFNFLTKFFSYNVILGLCSMGVLLFISINSFSKRAAHNELPA